MKALLATINYDHPQVGQHDAFCKVFGADSVRECDYLAIGRARGDPNGALLAAAREHQPDWLWLQLQDTGTITPATLGAINEAVPHCVITHWTGDCRPQVSGYLSSICRATHATLCSSVGQIPMFEAAGAKHVQYVQIGLDWDEDIAAPTRLPPFPIPDAVFCGGHYGSVFPGTTLRAGVIRALMDAGIGVGVVGPGWPRGFPSIGTCPVKQQIHVWRAAKVCINVNHFNDIERYYSDRQLIAMASGKPVACAYVPGLEHEFEDRKHCMWFRTPEQAVEVVRELLADDDLRQQIGTAGRAEVVANHTWEKRIGDLLPFVESLRAAPRAHVE